ncbi:MAG TPA: hypothetical protein VK014_02460 [Cyclobacteriaceae bacterium]|nr:hypothetical protein [Cyclobacteriaceae bacterium]
MDLNKFKKLRESYAKQIGRGEYGKNREGKKITDQTQSIWFDRKTIQDLLDQTDEKTGGIKIYFGEYDEDTADEVTSVKDTKDLVGRLTVILAASNDNEDPTDGKLLKNGGKICPPNCTRD